MPTEQSKPSADAQSQPEPLAHLEEEPKATQSFQQFVGFDLTTFAWEHLNPILAPKWTKSDENPPLITTIGPNGKFELKKNWKASPDHCYKLNVSYSYDHVSTPIFPQTGQEYEVTVNTTPSRIAAFRQGLNINQFQHDYRTAGQVGAVQYGWHMWTTPFSTPRMITSGQISDEGYNHLSWQPPHSKFMVYSEINPGVHPLPAPGLTPADWPNGAADPLLVLVLPGTWLKE